jgi:pimeloyl-ACP methyl ester carboxylesterase
MLKTEPDEKSKSLEEMVKSTKTLSLPALLIHGEMDGVGPPYTSENIHEKFTGPFNRIIIPGVGHFPSREAPDEISAHIVGFFKEHLIIN